MSLAAEVQEMFAADPPTWVSAFIKAPVESLDALFAGRWYHGALNAEDPEELLLDWAEGLATVESFMQLLDESLADWIELRWCTLSGDPTPEVTWHRALRVGALLHRQLPATVETLHARRNDAPDFLGPMARNPSRDPLGWYWTCLAQHQDDDELRNVWWSLSELTPGTPWFHGRIGLLGLRRLPGPDLGGFRQSAAFGLLRLAEALDARVDARMIKQGTAERAVRAAAVELLHALPFPASWNAFWNATRSAGLNERPREWLTSVLGEPQHQSSKGVSAKDPTSFDPDWPRRSSAIASLLRRAERSGIADAERLIAEQRRYARATGDRHGFIRTLCNLSAASTIGGLPAPARTWASEARSLDPANPFTWTSAARAELALGHHGRARGLSFEAIERFPDNVVVRNVLAEVLKAGGDLDSAEAVYREGIARFPDDAVGRCGLAEVLKGRGELETAEAIYRETLTLFPDDAAVRCGLAEVLKSGGDLEGAEIIYSQALTLFPDDAAVRSGLAEIRKARSRLDSGDSLADVLDSGSDAGGARTPQTHGLSQADEADAAASTASAQLTEIRILMRFGGRTTHDERRRTLEDAHARINALIDQTPFYLDALFTHVQLLHELELLDHARKALAALPAYIAERPEFQALKGRVELDQIRFNKPTRYEPGALDAVFRAWTDAGQQHSALRLNVPVVKLRASSLVYDGAVLDEVRRDAMSQVRATLAQQDELPPDRDSQRNASLRAWWRRELSSILEPMDEANAALSFAEAEPLLAQTSAQLDSLERELVDASRYTSSAA